MLIQVFQDVSVRCKKLRTAGGSRFKGMKETNERGRVTNNPHTNRIHFNLL